MANEDFGDCRFPPATYYVKQDSETDIFFDNLQLWNLPLTRQVGVGIARRLNKRKVESQTGKPWTPQMVQGIVRTNG